MIAMQDIRDVSERIALEYHPERIVLFGSHATGGAAADSDVDLLVVMPFEGSSARMAANIANRVKPEIPVELLVRTPEQLRNRLAGNDFFLQEVMETGRTLYAANHVGMDCQS